MIRFSGHHVLTLFDRKIRAPAASAKSMFLQRLRLPPRKSRAGCAESLDEGSRNTKRQGSVAGETPRKKI
jgi:hypothetical protein